MQRLSSFSSRFVAVERSVLHRSPIIFTPYRKDGAIDADALGAFVDRQYADAGLTHDDVDTGAVILTGTALERCNAAEIGELFAQHGGKFVCATAGHRLEAILAAHGSGAVARSRREGIVVLNIDVGGGTTKLALADRGEIVATSAIAVGARLVTFDAHGHPVRVERAAKLFADHAGVRMRGNVALPATRRNLLAVAMADAIARAAAGSALHDTLVPAQLLGPLPAHPTPTVTTLSGGVAEHFYGRTAEDHSDLGRELASALADAELPGRLAEPEEAIRATVVGASQFSVQLSGSTIFVSDERVLPLRNVPVVAVHPDGSSTDEVERAIREAIARATDDRGPLMIALPFEGEPCYADLRALAEGLCRAVGDRRPLVAAVSGDVALSIGRILAEEIGVEGGIVVIDDLALGDLDYVDVGQIVRPAGVVPVVVKTLVLGGSVRSATHPQDLGGPPHGAAAPEGASPRMPSRSRP